MMEINSGSDDDGDNSGDNNGGDDKANDDGADSVTSIEGNLDYNISIYPNPVRDRLLIDWDVSVSDIYVELISSSGTLICTYQYSNSFDTMSLDMQKYASGVYYLRVTVGDRIELFNLIKE